MTARKIADESLYLVQASSLLSEAANAQQAEHLQTHPEDAVFISVAPCKDVLTGKVLAGYNIKAEFPYRAEESTPAQREAILKALQEKAPDAVQYALGGTGNPYASTPQHPEKLLARKAEDLATLVNAQYPGQGKLPAPPAEGFSKGALLRS